MKINKIIPGLALVFFISFFAKFISTYVQIGSVACAIIIGIIIGNIFGVKDNMKDGISFAEKKILSVAIVLMGAQLNAGILDLINYKVLIILISVIATSVLSAFCLGKLFKMKSSLSVLLGVGNGICGSSAIAASSSITGSKDEETGLSIAVINILGAFGIFLLPAFITFFGVEGIYNQGLLIGGTIQAVGQVTASGFMMGDEVGKFATLVKMVRILMLGPMILILGVLFKSKKNNKSNTSMFHVPGFIIGFILLSIIVSMNIINHNVIEYLTDFSKYFLILAMSAIGLNVSLSFILNKGVKVFSVASVTFLIQIFVCMFLTGYFL